MKLVVDPNMSAPDDFYEALIEAHQGLSTAQSHAMNARLVLLLANHVGDLDVVRQALRAARESGSVEGGENESEASSNETRT